MTQPAKDESKGAVSVLRNYYKSFLDDAERFFDSFVFLSPLAEQVRELKGEIGKPFNIAFFGRMKAGKSSIVNALLGKDLAVTGVNETTATINIISRAVAPGQGETFIVHWKDKTCDVFPLSRLVSDWSGKGDEVMAKVGKVAFIQLFSDDPSLALHEIIDTPGTGAMVAEHEKVAQEFLDPSIQEGRKADALVYVFGVNGRETDEKDLKSFREGTLAQSYPYNSVGVLHKWDLTYWNSGGDWSEIKGKCARIKSQLGAVVADVIPISAPLAKIAARTSDEQLGDILDLVAQCDARHLNNILSDDEEWDEDARRCTIRKSLGIPWVCFQVAVREAQCLGKGATVKAFRGRLEELGGLAKLKIFLDSHFYKDSEIIRQQNQYRKFEAVRKEALFRVDDKLEQLNADIGFWDELFARRLEPRNLEAWVEKKRADAISSRERLKAASIEFDSIIRNSPVAIVLRDVEALNWCRLHEKEVGEIACDALRKAIDYLAGDNTIQVDKEALQGFRKRIRLLEGMSDASGSKILRHISRRIGSLVSEVGYC